jgi:predicted CXXCH cytochrome family protein
MNKLLLIIVLVVAAIGLTAGITILAPGDYQGTENCEQCHKGALGSFPGYAKWQETLHNKIHELPTQANMVGDYTKTLSFGTAYGNANATFRVDAGKWYVKMNPSSGEAKEYEVVYTYGIGWKQRYLVKIENSYYMPPVQWNLNGYKDNTTGTWVAYNPGNWFNADGTLKPINNAFRAKSWDKNCAGCHVVPGFKTNTVQKTVNGQDTAWVYNWGGNNSHKSITIGCESCHGYAKSAMGDEHVNNLKNMSYDRRLEVCGQCHTRGTSNLGTYEYPYDENTGNTYPVGEDLMQYYINKPGVHADKFTARQHHQQWVDWKNTKHYNANMNMTCVTCHDPHQNTQFNFQLKEDFRAITEGSGCVKCHSNKTEVVNGLNTHTKHPVSASTCVSCHMPKTAGSGKGWDISGHSFKVISPEKTLTYKDVTTPIKGMPNSCALSCHRNGKGTFGTGKNFGITDATLGDWSEASDIALADSLLKYYKEMFPTSVVEKEYGFPTNYNLAQNYPNPFSTSTTVRFEVSAPANIKLEVLTIRGELANVLTNQYYDTGIYELAWDGSTGNGFYLSSGIYYLSYSVNGTTVGSRTMIIAK